MRLDHGNPVGQNGFQRKLWPHWLAFWREFVAPIVQGKRWAWVNNGDPLEGLHHGTTSQYTHNLAVQSDIAEACFKIPLSLGPDVVYFVRGTEAHGGESGQHEEKLADRCGAKPDKKHRHARDVLWLKVETKTGRGLAQFLHHISVSGNPSCESNALSAEYAKVLHNAARWGEPVPDWIVRGHAHRYVTLPVETRTGTTHITVCPGWQGKTPHCYKLAAVRNNLGTVGGIALTIENGQRMVRAYTHTPRREEIEYG